MDGDARLEEIALLLIDGDNLLHEVRGSRDAGAVAWLLPRLRSWRPQGMRIVVALDGHAEPGQREQRVIAPGVEIRHSGSRSADDLLIELLSAQPYAERTRSAIVTDDRGLADRARRAGGWTRKVAWLLRQLSAPSAPGRAPAQAAGPVGIGQGRAPRRLSPGPAHGHPAGHATGDLHLHTAWQPGRGATRKRGNPRRGNKPPRTPWR